MRRPAWLNAVLRTTVGLSASVCWAYLKKADAGGALTDRSGVIGWLGAVILLAGWSLHFWSNVTLARYEARPLDAPTTVVADGPYQYVRNPIYLAGLPIFLGIYPLYAWHGRDIVAPVAVSMVFHLLVVRVEEPALRKRFGSAYEEYCRRVPRWLPRWARRRAAARNPDAVDETRVSSAE